jgi:hypothetical protein
MGFPMMFAILFASKLRSGATSFRQELELLTVSNSIDMVREKKSGSSALYLPPRPG